MKGVAMSEKVHIRFSVTRPKTVLDNKKEREVLVDVLAAPGTNDFGIVSLPNNDFKTVPPVSGHQIEEITETFYENGFNASFVGAERHHTLGADAGGSIEDILYLLSVGDLSTRI